ncbi:TetR/AcrR family transcriptional regulator [Nocardia sp. NPDC051570]|uniref:TetR/AcrR family transcriptional regulator n=1 Tax=Nocardia sp. NPDC051570 TaxID=3364324 RepID=UPI00378D81D5
MTDDRAGRRRGPRTDVDTHTVILETAERLFGDGSAETISLRSVARAAGVTTRAISYHFADRRELLRAVLARRGGPIAETIAQRLDGLSRAPTAPSLGEVVRALLDPYVALLDDDPVGGRRWLRILIRHSEMWPPEPDSAALFAAAAGRALTGVSPDELEHRARIALLSMTTTLAHGAGMRDTDRRWVSHLADFLTAGIRGPHGTAPLATDHRTPVPEMRSRASRTSARGRPRDPRRRTAVMTAARELLGERGYDELTLSEVARRAGVSRPFVYDHWGSRPALVGDAILTAPHHDPPTDADKPFARAITDLIEATMRLQSDPIQLAGLSALTSGPRHRTDLLARLDAGDTAPIRAAFLRLIERGKADGVVRPDIDGPALFDTVRGAATMHLLTDPADRANPIAHLTAIVLRAITPQE